jgi:hypothetical protein
MIDIIKPNGRPWYIWCLELVLNKEGFLAVVVLLMGFVFWTNSKADRAERAADNKLQREQSKVLVDLLKETAGRNAASMEKLEQAAETMAPVPAIREKELQLALESNDSLKQIQSRHEEMAKSLAIFKEIQAEAAQATEVRDELLNGHKQLLDGQKQILEKLPN